MCESCILGKQTKTPFPEIGCRATQLLELIHTDLGGSLPPSLGGSRFHLLFIDDYSRYVVVYFLKRKS